MSVENDTTTHGPSKVSRRNLIAGAALAVPAVAVVNAGSAWASPVVTSLIGMPAFVSSQNTTVTGAALVKDSFTATKENGQKGYVEAEFSFEYMRSAFGSSAASAPPTLTAQYTVLVFEGSVQKSSTIGAVVLVPGTPFTGTWKVPASVFGGVNSGTTYSFKLEVTAADVTVGTTTFKTTTLGPLTVEAP